MKLTNMQIYDYATAFSQGFNDPYLKFPVKVNFYIVKNKSVLTELAKDIETHRLEIIKEFGQYNEATGQYDIDKDKINEATKSINELFSIEQEVQIYTIKLEDMGDKLNLSTSQMEALLFMIED